MTAKRIGRDPSPTDLGFKLIDEMTAKLAKMRAVADTDEFRILANLMEGASWGSGTPAVGYDHAHWEFAVYLQNLNSFDDISVLRENIHALNADEYEVKEYPDSNNNDYIWTFKYEGDIEIKARICAYLDKMAPGACRRIQVGTEMKEVPVYKNVCSGDIPDVSGALPAPVINIEAL